MAISRKVVGENVHILRKGDVTTVHGAIRSDDF